MLRLIWRFPAKFVRVEYHHPCACVSGLIDYPVSEKVSTMSPNRKATENRLMDEWRTI
jgi:hypothetical protein